MTTIPATALTILAGVAAFSLPALSSAADEACTPRIVQSQTTFPIGSQLRRQAGTVYIEVTLDEKGRARTATVHESSGHQRLDRAARYSVVKNWVFDVSGCAGKDLQARHLVAVEYRGDDAVTAPSPTLPRLAGEGEGEKTLKPASLPPRSAGRTGRADLNSR